jgi:hypothetical protein
MTDAQKKSTAGTKRHGTWRAAHFARCPPIILLEAPEASQELVRNIGVT